MNTIESMMQAINEGRKSAATNLRLGAFIRLLEIRPPDQRLTFDFCGMVPSGFDSYRGFYEDLSLNFVDGNAKSATVAAILKEAREAVGATFTGYKGGDFRMSEKNLLWVSRYGESHSTAIVGVTGDDYETVIETAWVPH